MKDKKNTDLNDLRYSLDNNDRHNISKSDEKKLYILKENIDFFSNPEVAIWDLLRHGQRFIYSKKELLEAIENDYCVVITKKLLTRYLKEIEDKYILKLKYKKVTRYMALPIVLASKSGKSDLDIGMIYDSPDYLY